jgi:periplasmic protein CpxP/Spy
MKKYLNIILLLACITLPVAAYSLERETTTTHTNGTGMMDHKGMMSSSAMTMHPKMQEMSALMQQIVLEDNQEKREVLMAEHMKKMQENMQLMDKSMPLQSTDAEDQQIVPIDERINVLEGRIYMMQIMMDQMMNHNAQREMKPKQMHKVN